MSRLDEIIDEAVSYGVESANSDASQERLEVDRQVISETKTEIRDLFKGRIQAAYGLIDGKTPAAKILPWLEKEVDQL
jgi:hypothetical protein